MSFQPYQQRVVDEKATLDKMVESLNVYLESPEFAKVPKPERNRMIRQSHIMGMYSQVLGERIAAFMAVIVADKALES